MLIQLATIAGRDDRPNEDFPAALPGCAVLLDGAGGPAEMPTGCVHGTGWYVRQLGARLLAGMETEPETSLTELLADGISAVAERHAGTCDLSNPGTPSTTVVMARLGPGAVQWLVLGDSSLVFGRDGQEPAVISDQRIEEVAVAEQDAMKALPTDSPEHFAARVRFVGRQRELRNRPDGYWITSADPAAASHAWTGSEPAADLDTITLLSDGATRFTEFSLGSWGDLLGLLDTEGIGAVFGRIRDAEAGDPDGARWPRAKRHDDAAIVHFSQPGLVSGGR
jgi:serine/threonine protein phosphatase PrpC